MKVRFTPEARTAAREKRTWWEQHRDKAPRLFVEELAEIVAKPKTKIHVYYRVDEVAAEVEVLLLWNAIAATGPNL